MIVRLLVVLAATVALAGCGSFGGGGVPENAAVIHIVNATSFPVQMQVNGAPRNTIPPWTPVQEMPIFGPDGPPWRLDFFGPHGQQVAALEVDGPARPNEGSSSSQSSSCGTFMVWWGAVPGGVQVVVPEAAPPPPPPCT